ncbi:hypothetical protein LC574_02475 [Nostoc sp. CHAB 5715]|nr:hypothetical protein [Nostoc sp. CHAB 5715]
MIKTLIIRDSIDILTGKKKTRRFVVELNHIDELPAAMAELNRRFPRFEKGQRHD